MGMLAMLRANCVLPVPLQILGPVLGPQSVPFVLLGSIRYHQMLRRVRPAMEHVLGQQRVCKFRVPKAACEENIQMQQVQYFYRPVSIVLLGNILLRWAKYVRAIANVRREDIR